MGTTLLSIYIISCKILSLICLLISLYSYHWFHIDDYSVNKALVQSVCLSYGAFCNFEDQMPLPRLIVTIPCIIVAISLLLEIINQLLLCSIWQRVRTILNFFLEQTNIALSFATTIHCIWVTIVHIRISMELSIVHLDWTFFPFAIATVLIPLECICSISRIMHNCQYEKSNPSRHSFQVYACRHRSIIDSDI